MVIDNTNIPDNTGKIKIKLKNHLTCKNYGIYAAQCRICKQFYVGQTKNKFSVRWNTHRNKWKTFCRGQENIKEGNDEAALFKHYKKVHPKIKLTDYSIADAYGVVFIEQPSFKDLDIRESYWISRLLASINIAKTIIPKYG